MPILALVAFCPAYWGQSCLFVYLADLCFPGQSVPTGSPPKAAIPPSNPPVTVAPPAAVSQQDPSALLAVLAGLAPQQTSQTNPMPVAMPPMPFAQNAYPPPPLGFVPPPPPPPAPVVNNAPPSNNPVQTGDVTQIASQIFQAMQAGTISQEQAFQVLNMLAAAQNGGIPAAPAQAAALPAPLAQNGAQPERFEQNGSRFRDRSRSPDYDRRRQSPRRSPPMRRNSPTYGAYDPNAAADGNQFDRGDRGRGRGNKSRAGRNDRNEYRQRSPPPRWASPGGNASAPANGTSKFIEWDPQLPRDHIRVLSRTLFIGGASGTEAEIRQIFSQFGKVQSCIVNQDKRHAFVKMLTRPDALAAKAGMVNNQDPVAISKARQVRTIHLIPRIVSATTADCSCLFYFEPG